MGLFKIAFGSMDDQQHKDISKNFFLLFLFSVVPFFVVVACPQFTC